MVVAASCRVAPTWRTASAPPPRQVNRALVRHGLPFGAKAAEPKAIETYPFSHDPKVRRCERARGKCMRTRASCAPPRLLHSREGTPATAAAGIARSPCSFKIAVSKPI